MDGAFSADNDRGNGMLFRKTWLGVRASVQVVLTTRYFCWYSVLDSDFVIILASTEIASIGIVIQYLTIMIGLMSTLQHCIVQYIPV